MSDTIDATPEPVEPTPYDDGELARTVTRLGDSTDQLTTVLGKVDENQKALLKLRGEVDEVRLKGKTDAIRLEAQNELIKVRNKTAVLILVIMLIAASASLFSYTRVRSESNAADAAQISTFTSQNRCQIDFNTRVLIILKERGRLDGESESNLRVLLEKIAIPGSSFEAGQNARRDYIAKAIVIQAQRDSLNFPKTNC